MRPVYGAARVAASLSKRKSARFDSGIDRIGWYWVLSIRYTVFGRVNFERYVIRNQYDEAEIHVKLKNMYLYSTTTTNTINTGGLGT